MANNTIIYESAKKLNSEWINKNATSHEFANGKGKIVLKNGVTTIETKAMGWCHELKSITFSTSITEFGYYAFIGSNKLTTITIPASVKKIHSTAFCDCENLTSIIVAKENPIYDSRNNCNAIIETKTNKLIKGCPNTIIPDSVTEINDCAFSRCKNLTSILIPNTITKIGRYAFNECKNLTSITIPKSVTKINDFTFTNCNNLNSITLPDSITEIGLGAFAGCTNLASISIPDSITKIDNGAFSYCIKLPKETIDKIRKLNETIK